MKIISKRENRFGQDRTTKMKVSDFSRYALGICAAVAILVGCSSATSVTPPQGNGLSSNSSRALRTIAYGLEPLRRGTEQLTGSGTGQAGCGISLNVKG